MGDLRFNIDAALVLLRELGYRGDALMVEATRFNVIESEYKAMLRDIKDANTVREEFRKRAAEKLKARFGQRDEQQRLLGPGNG